MAKNGSKNSKALALVTDEAETKPDNKLVDETVEWIREKIVKTTWCRFGRRIRRRAHRFAHWRSAAPQTLRSGCRSRRFTEP
jgi:hypothetical protein